MLDAGDAQRITGACAGFVRMLCVYVLYKIGLPGIATI